MVVNLDGFENLPGLRTPGCWFRATLYGRKM